MFKPDDQSFWNDCINCFDSTPLTYTGGEYWFTDNHIHDIEAFQSNPFYFSEILSTGKNYLVNLDNYI